MRIKTLIQKIIFKERANQETLIAYLRSKGAVIGEDVNFFSFRNVHIDSLNPHLITIGNHVNIVASTILTHDYAWSVVKGMCGEILGNQRPVSIGNNVFIGDGSIVLCGSVIEDNVIIGARSVVSGHCDSGYVYAGNPARKIMSLNDYYTKRKSKQVDEAKEFVKLYYERIGEIPPEQKLHEYFFLFQHDISKMNDLFKHRITQCGTYDESMKYLSENKPLFDGYQDFISACLKDEQAK